MQESNPAGIIRGEFAAWADHVASLGFADFLTAEDGFASEIRSGGPWLRARDSGIYTWITEGGEAYVGQTVNARSRLKQHWKNYRDIVYVAFKPVLLNRLDEEEPRMIAAIEARFPVLNISFANPRRLSSPLIVSSLRTRPGASWTVIALTRQTTGGTGLFCIASRPAASKISNATNCAATRSIHFDAILNAAFHIQQQQR